MCVWFGSLLCNGLVLQSGEIAHKRVPNYYYYHRIQRCFVGTGKRSRENEVDCNGKQVPVATVFLFRFRKTRVYQNAFEKS